jgi:hypothetical protein
MLKQRKGEIVVIGKCKSYKSRIIKSVTNDTKLWCMIKYISKGKLVFVMKKQMLKHKDNENAILKQKKPNHKDNLKLSPEMILTISQ